MPRMGALFVIRDTLLKDRTEVDETTTKTTAQPQLNLLKETKSTDNNNCDENGNENEQQQEHKGRDKSKVMEKEQEEPRNGNLREMRCDEKSSGAGKEEEDCELDYILDITIGYPDGKPLNLQNIIMGLREPCETVFYYRLYSTKDVSDN